MMYIKKISTVLLLSLFISKGHAESYKDQTHYEPLTAYSAAKALKWEIGLVAGSAIYLGLKNWNWGSRNHFKLNDEGWFGTDTGSAGADKLGHMYSTYLINEYFTKSLIKKTNNVSDSAKYSALFSTSIMLLVEVFDGYSDDHGFSYEDVVLNSLGVGFSYLKNTIPGLDEKIDLRVEYAPSNPPHNRHPVTDYSGYKYLTALRLGGFETFKDTPLKYLELQLGYQAQGFKKDEYKYFSEKSTQLYVGVSFNLTELLFKPAKSYTESPVMDYLDTFTRYYQIPNTTLSTPLHERKVPY
jgi:hypothetical protein